jgi:hypothetical protein
MTSPLLILFFSAPVFRTGTCSVVDGQIWSFPQERHEADQMASAALEEAACAASRTRQLAAMVATRAAGADLAQAGGVLEREGSKALKAGAADLRDAEALQVGLISNVLGFRV